MNGPVPDGGKYQSSAPIASEISPQVEGVQQKARSAAAGGNSVFGQKAVLN
jgi:hypothetical protein